MLHAVIMAGGSGTRFWPQSRQRLPKQLLKLAGERTMIQQTFDRCGQLIPPQNSWVVTNQLQADGTRQQLAGIPAEQILIEPAARNTAPCIGLAAIHVLQNDPDAVMLIMPADHVIAPAETFQNTITAAVNLLNDHPNRLVLFGMKPTFAATGYGYIEKGDSLEDHSLASDVKSFREKPIQEIAENYVKSGQFFWNCGIFCWRAQTILDQLKAAEPDTFDRLQAIAAAIGSDEYETVLNEQFPQMNSISIDYAVLEKATSATVIEADFDWDDVGSWLAVPRLNGTDSGGNTIQGRAVAIDTQNSIIRSTDDHLIATLGIDDLIVVHTPDATLVARKSESENIKQILEQLKQDGHTDLL